MKQLVCGRPEIQEAIKLFRFLGGRCIVEIGSIRDKNSVLSDGHSTFMWAENAEMVYTVDIDPQATVMTKALMEEYGYNNVYAITQDGIEYLKNFNHPIDLLYLDGWDAELEDTAERHLEAYLAARKNLHDESIILIDDANPEVLGISHSSKAALVLVEAEKDGFQVGLSLYQVLLAKADAISRFIANYPE